jgi:RND family efflux transporter MFP subunit
MKKYIYSIGITVLVPVSIFTGACSSDHAGTEVKKANPVPVTIGIAETTVDSNIHVSGYIEAGETAEISTRVMGFITGIHVKPGDIVKQGQLLATISNQDIQARRAQAKAMVTEAEAALNDAQKDYERYTELHQLQSVSTREFENATLRYTSVKAKAEAAQQMQYEAEAMLDYTNLKAPFHGVVVQKNMDAGTMAHPGQPILILEQSALHRVSASVPEVYIPRVRKGMPVDVIVKSTGQSIQGTISEVSPSSRFSGGQYLLKIDIPNSTHYTLYSGMNVNVVIATDEHLATHEHIVTVPAAAIFSKDQLTGIYTLGSKNTALLRWVRVGRTIGNRVEILAGITAGEKFILAGDERLYNGVPVAIQ